MKYLFSYFQNMSEILNFKGFIKGLSYQAYLTDEALKIFDLEDFDINEASSYGIISFDNIEVAFSKWVSPKRSRSYPFTKIYNTYNASQIITVILVIKSENNTKPKTEQLSLNLSIY